MNKTFLFLLALMVSLSSCTQNAQQSSESQDSIAYPNLIKVHITGVVPLPDSTKLYINTDENSMQPLLSGFVQKGSFTLDGELDEPNFYNLVVGKEKFKVYLENGKEYQFVADVALGKIKKGYFKSNSPATMDYGRLQEEIASKQASLSAQEASLRSAMNNPNTYQSAVERSAALTAKADELPGQLISDYINDPKIAPALKLFLIKDEKISKANYESYYQALSTSPDSLKSTSLYRQAEAKVKQVRDFFENMPDFPDIHPRNVAGDSLQLADFKGRETLLFAFWGSWNREAKNDIQMIKSNLSAMEKLGVTPIFLTWEKDFDAWEKASKSLGLGVHNYRLNAADQEFMVTHYAARQLPHYMLVNASDLSIIDYYFTFPLDGKLVNKLRKELKK